MTKQKEQLIVDGHNVTLIKHCTQVHIYIDGKYSGFTGGWTSAKTCAKKLIRGEF
jgi:hypothetical protein